MEIREIRDCYRMTCDLHTHTKYSHGFCYNHGKGSIEENADAASKKEIDILGISDHGPGHKFYGLDLKKLSEIREEIHAAEKKHPNLKIRLGVEANIINTANGLDVGKERIPDFDYIIAGYHYGLPKGHMTANYIYWHMGLPAGSTAQLRNQNTEMVLRALYENNIRILTHPGDKGPFDMNELCKACEKTDTLMEINTRHCHLTVPELRIASDYDVRFIISSDAHKPGDVGNFEKGINRAEEAGIDLGRIVNIEKR